MLGRVVETVHLEEPTGTSTLISVSGLSAGVYSYRFIVEGSARELGRLVFLD